jgi:hypothetical protein
MRYLPEWSDWRPKLLVPRWAIFLLWGAFILTFTLLLAHRCVAV